MSIWPNDPLIYPTNTEKCELCVVGVGLAGDDVIGRTYYRLYYEGEPLPIEGWIFNYCPYCGHKIKREVKYG